ncbi:MAG TPA: hypothetical protein VMV86_06000 [Methanosarcinales archaeon]|nr:hypothetical protein [Methanosarcinales archaeon]
MKYKRFTDDNVFVASRRNVPNAPGPSSSKKMSAERRAELSSQIGRGEFKEGFSGDVKPEKSVMTPYFVSGIKKNAGIGTASNTGEAGGSNAWSGSGGTVRQGPEIYSPLWLTSNTHLPRDRGTMNAWTRAFFALNPVVNNAVSLHSTYPISKLNITCPNKQVESFFNTMAEEMDLLNTCVQIAQEFYVIGEAFPQLELDVATRKWVRCIIQNPDYIYVNRTAIPGEPEISIRPDAELKRIVQQNDPESRKVRASLPAEVIKYIRAGKNIPLDNFYVSHLARKISPYETRGTSIIAPCFKALMLWDKLRECKYAQADNLINPITLVKLGGSADSEFKVSEADLLAWRELLESAQYDKDFKIITHGSVQIERIGAQTVIEINTDLERLIKEIYIGLMVPQVIMEAGDITYANGSLSLDVLRQRYMQFQNMLSKWIKTKVFAPIAQLNDFWEYEDGEKKLIIPNVEWNHMNLFDLSDYIQQISQLVGEKKLVSVHTLYRSLGLDYEDEQIKIRKENIDDAIHKKEVEMLSKLSLTQLKALNDEDEIPDLPDYPVPGESPEEQPAAPAGGEAGGAPGGMESMMGGGGLPPPPGGGEAPPA